MQKKSSVYCREKAAWTEKIEHMFPQPVLPQSPQSVKPGGRQERHAFILAQHAMMLFFQLHVLCL